MPFELRRLYPFDREAQRDVLALLKREGIAADRNLDYTVGLYDEADQLVATGSSFRNTLRCLAVDSGYRGEGLLNTLVSHLVHELATRGHFNVFLHTKHDTARFFSQLGFYTIAEVNRSLVFMENSRDAFSRYLERISAQRVDAPRAGAIVMNANPFTLGHQYLVEKASRECDVLHLFTVREDVSAFPYAVREQLIRQGTRHLGNLRYHDTDNYIVSSATFPSYFIQDSEAVTRAQAAVDAAVFGRIAGVLGLSVRFVGDEPYSFATNLYNQVMSERLPGFGVELVIVPRREGAGNLPISATRVRERIMANDLEGLQPLVPDTTYDFLASPEGLELMQKIRDR